MSAYRCNPCSALWPPTTEYVNCPECGERCSMFSHTDPMPVDEAVSRKKHADFERYYADHCAKKLNDELDELDAA